MFDIWEISSKVQIAFALTMIVLLLMYIAFIKDSVDKKQHGKSERL